MNRSTLLACILLSGILIGVTGCNNNQTQETQISQLKEEVAKLRGEVDSLNQKLAAAKPVSTPAVPNGDQAARIAQLESEKAELQRQLDEARKSIGAQPNPTPLTRLDDKALAATYATAAAKLKDDLARDLTPEKTKDILHAHDSTVPPKITVTLDSTAPVNLTFAATPPPPPPFMPYQSKYSIKLDPGAGFLSVMLDFDVSADASGAWKFPDSATVETLLRSKLQTVRPGPSNSRNTPSPKATFNPNQPPIPPH